MTKGEFARALATIYSAIQLAEDATKNTATLGQMLELLRHARLLRDEVLPLLAATTPGHVIDRLDDVFNEVVGLLEDGATDIRRHTLPLGDGHER